MIKLLALIFSLPAFAANPGNAPTTTLSAPGANTAQATVSPGQLVTGCAASGSSGCFSLYVGQGTTSGDFYPLLLNGTNYATPSTKKTYCFNFTGSSSTGSNQLQLVSSQTAFSNNATSIVSGTYQCGGSGTANCMATNATSNVPGVMPGTFTFGDGSHVTYVGIEANTTAALYNFHMDCFEQ